MNVVILILVEESDFSQNCFNGSTSLAVQSFNIQNTVLEKPAQQEKV